MTDIQKKINELGVSIIDRKTGEFRSLQDIMIDVAKVFKDFRNQNKTETNQSIIKEREAIIDDICLSFARSEKDKDIVKALLFKL